MPLPGSMFISFEKIHGFEPETSMKRDALSNDFRFSRRNCYLESAKVLFSVCKLHLEEAKLIDLLNILAADSAII